MIRIAKISIPAIAQEEFNDFINMKKLKAAVISTKDDMCLVEITYTKSQTAIIDEIEKNLSEITALALVCISALSAMVSKPQESKDKK